MAEERIRILQMLQEQKITVDEAERLLATLASLDEAEAPDQMGHAHRRHAGRGGHDRHAHDHHGHESHEQDSPRKRKIYRKTRHGHGPHGGEAEGFFGGMTDWATGFADDMTSWAEDFARDFADDADCLAEDCEDIAADIQDMDIPGIFEGFGPFRAGMQPPRPPKPPKPPRPPRVRRRVMVHRGDPDRRSKRGRNFTPGWDIRASELTAALHLLDLEDVHPSAIGRLRRHDVTPEYIRALHEVGLETASVKELVGLRIFETEPGFLHEMREHFPDSTVKEIIALSKYGVDPAYVASLYDAGLTNLTPRQVIELSAYNLDPVAVKTAWDEDPDRAPRQIYRDVKGASAEAEVAVEVEMEAEEDSDEA